MWLLLGTSSPYAAGADCTLIALGPIDKEIRAL